MVLNAIKNPFPGECAYLVLDKDTGLAQNYRQLIKNPKTKVLWEERFCYELGRLTQGYKHIKGTNTARFLTIADICNIPVDRTVTYARIVVDYWPQKEDPYRV